MMCKKVLYCKIEPENMPRQPLNLTKPGDGIILFLILEVDMYSKEISLSYG